LKAIMIAIKKLAAYATVHWALAILSTQNSFAALPIQHWTQPSGVAVYLVESPAIPMVDVQVDFDAGSRRDPADKAGLASVMAGMTAKGVRGEGAAAASGRPKQCTAPSGGSAIREATSVGAIPLDENGLSEAWADLGASFGASASSDRLSFSLRSLTYPDLLPKAVALAARQMGEPAFPADVWERERARLSASIREANTRPATLAAKAFAAAVYGDHPYGYDTTEATLARISVADMQTLHARLLAPCRARVSVVGAVTRAQADALVTQLFARLPSGAACDALPVVPEVAALTQALDQRIAFDSAQAHVLIGQPGYPRSDPDFFALTVGNYILGGGGFVSRLTEEVREKRGLSYSVYSYFAPGLHAGAFTLGLQTRPDQVEQAVKVSRDVLASFVAQGPTAKELKAAKDNLIGGFALRIDSNRKLLDNVANIAWNRLALDYLDTWTQQVARVGLADIRAAFTRKLQPEKMVTVVVGGAATPATAGAVK
jgi:zinc protease